MCCKSCIHCVSLRFVFCYFLKLDYSIIRFFRIVNGFYQKNRIFSYF
nr:MAG TPA: hypothetical protein [Caudoviricetes sp.]